MEEAAARKRAAWVDFSVCLLLGWLGIHKFREHKTFLGLLYMFTLGLFYIGWIVDTIRYLIWAVKGGRPQAQLPAAQASGYPAQTSGYAAYAPTYLNKPLVLDDDQPLPVVSSNVLLSAGEQCHYSGRATRLEIKNRVVGYTGSSGGVSVRVVKGVSYRTGTSGRQAIREDVQIKTNGFLSVTSKRVVCSAGRGAFDKKISAISSIIPADDGFLFHVGESEYMIETANAQYIVQLITRIRQESEA